MKTCALLTGSRRATAPALQRRRQFLTERGRSAGGIYGHLAADHRLPVPGERFKAVLLHF